MGLEESVQLNNAQDNSHSSMNCRNRWWLHNKSFHLNKLSPVMNRRRVFAISLCQLPQEKGVMRIQVRRTKVIVFLSELVLLIVVSAGGIPKAVLPVHSCRRSRCQVLSSR